MFRLKNQLQRAIKPSVTRRMMSGGLSAPPTGLDATVRNVLPHDHQVRYVSSIPNVYVLQYRL